MTCEWIPGDAIPACDWDRGCPDHGDRGSHFGLDGFGGVSHKGKREDCSHPDCAWPRAGDTVTAVSGGREVTGELIELTSPPFLIQTLSGDEFEIDPTSIRRPDWGTYCPHGRKVVKAVPAEHTCQPPRPLCTIGVDDPFHMCEPDSCPACYPSGRIAEPWPCGKQGCTREAFEKSMQDEIDECHEALYELMRNQYE